MKNAFDKFKDDFLSGFTPEAPNGMFTDLPVRETARDALDELQIPTTKWEAWKYTSVKSIVERAYKQGELTEIKDIDPFLIPGFEAKLLVFVNGAYHEGLSSVTSEEGIDIIPVKNLDGENKELFREYFAGLVEPKKELFTALNTAYVKEGVFIRVHKNVAPELPVCILHVGNPEQNNLGTQVRNLFVVESGAKLNVVETYRSMAGGISYRNAVTEIYVKENASAEYLKLQMENDGASHTETTRVKQSNDSRFSIYTMTFGGGLVRNDLNIYMDGENCESILNGLYLLDEEQHVDNHTQVDHAKPHSYSNELYKGVLSGSSTAVFNGRIHVHKDAQKTNAFQSNRNILLTDEANVYSKPQLEIYADDVKCSHGATTGQLDDDAMFYMRSRGIKEEEARNLLMHAFAAEVLENYSQDSVKEYLYGLIEKRFID